MRRTVILCDVCPDDEEAPAEVEATITLDGRKSTLDVCKEHETEILDMMELGLMTGKKKAPAKKTPAKKTSAEKAAPSSSGATNDEIRVWALDHGYSLNTRGRIPVDVRAAYEKAHS
jgi:Lsr2